MTGYSWDFSTIQSGLPSLLDGLKVTLELTVYCGIIGVVCGFVVCLMAISKTPFLRWPAMTFIEIFRCTPALMQIIWIFYCIPYFFGVFWPPMVMAIIALGMNCTAFNAEAFRAAIQAIPASHYDACTALGITSFKRTVYIILPQAVMIAMPVLLTYVIGLLQQTALVSTVAIADLMYEGKSLSTQSYRPIEVYTTVALIYFLCSLPLSQIVGVWEKRLSNRLA
jgi:polar amino acid transport system permease protein